MSDHRPIPFPPSAIARFPAFEKVVAGRRLAVFLDYDGTLTPIVDRPDRAVLDDGARAVLRRLAAVLPVAIVSGRDLEDVSRLVGLPDLAYAGSHGFDIRAPGLRVQIGEDALPALAAAQAELGERLAAVDGCLVERKRFAIAVHTRLVAADRKPEVERTVGAVATSHPELRVTGGKEIHELRPNQPWNKGRAVEDLIRRLGLADALPLYIGDDETDEDAFRALRGGGIGVRVMERPVPTEAGWSLRSPAEVVDLLDRLARA